MEITVPAGQTAALVAELRDCEGVFGIGLRPNGSLVPPGDIITLQCSNRAYGPLLKLLDRHEIGRAPGTSIVSSLPASLVSREAGPVVTTDASDSSWEEVEQMLAKESHMNANSGVIMFAAGFFAAAGIATGALHVVIAAMVIAPGFEPFLRIALGIITGSQAWRRGLMSAALGYVLLVAGAVAAALLLSRTGTPLFTGLRAYEDSAPLVRYWSTFSIGSATVSILAAVAGTLLVISHRSVLTAGVMIALALVPTAALVGMGIVELDGGVTGMAALRFLAEIAIVVAAAILVFLGQRRRSGRRRMLL